MCFDDRILHEFEENIARKRVEHDEHNENSEPSHREHAQERERGAAQHNAKRDEPHGADCERLEKIGAKERIEAAHIAIARHEQEGENAEQNLVQAFEAHKGDSKHEQQAHSEGAVDAIIEIIGICAEDEKRHIAQNNARNAPKRGFAPLQ